jgi:glycosyltransferase involved in cell wall biosynthesis
LLEGYSYEFVNNIAKDPGVHHFNGIINPDLNRIISSWNPSSILIFGWNYRSHLSCLRHFKGKVSILFRGDSTLLDEKPGIKRILRRFFLKWVYGRVDYALYVGKNNHDYFRIHGLREDQLVWVPHAIDNERFVGDNHLEQSARKWRSELGIASSDLVILFAGKLESKKDPYFMLRMAEQIKDSRLKFIIVGNGKLEKELKKKGSADKRIIFLDFQNQQIMPVVYRLSDIFVLPSVGPGETWGLAVNEAMACKRPVMVSSKCGCAPDLVEENITGWLFEPGEKGDFAMKENVQKILAEHNVLDSMGNHAYQKIQQYSYPVAIKRMKLLFCKISPQEK